MIGNIVNKAAEVSATQNKKRSVQNSGMVFSEKK